MKTLHADELPDLTEFAVYIPYVNCSDMYVCECESCDLKRRERVRQVAEELGKRWALRSASRPIPVDADDDELSESGVRARATVRPASRVARLRAVT